MSKRSVWLHVLAWAVACLVLLISLFSAAKLGTDKAATASGRRFYLSRNILPDHVFYPVLMVIDRVALQTATSPQSRVYMQVNYAYRRLTAAQALVEKQENALALTTLTKSQKYLNQAALDTLNAQLSVEDRRMVIQAIETQDELMEQLVPHFTILDQGVLDGLRSESKILENKLTDSMK